MAEKILREDKKMIKINLIGAMGNQMFEYAFARALSEKFKDSEIVINPYFSLFYNLAAVHSIKMDENTLTNFCLNSDVKEITMAEGFASAGVEAVKYGFECLPITAPLSNTQYLSRTSKGNYRLSKLGFTYYPYADVSASNKNVTGLYQSEKYFTNIRHVLLKEFEVKTEPSIQNQKMIEELESCNSVCVHVRRGDYLRPEFSFLNICDENYYLRGMDFIAKNIDSPLFYIFSNTHEDLCWIKENYHFNFPVKYVDLSNPNYEELRLMYHCKHFLMPNSTFSWWGSYLARNPNKMVVVPDIWCTKSYPETMDIYRKDMIKIPVKA